MMVHIIVNVVLTVVMLILVSVFVLICQRIWLGSRENYHEKPAEKVVETEPEEVHCVECGVRLLKSKAQRVVGSSWSGSGDNYYCEAHKKPYESFTFFSSKHMFFKEIEVTEDGTPIGYTKIKLQKKK